MDFLLCQGQYLCADIRHRLESLLGFGNSQPPLPPVCFLHFQKAGGSVNKKDVSEDTEDTSSDSEEDSEEETEETETSFDSELNASESLTECEFTDSEGRPNPFIKHQVRYPKTYLVKLIFVFMPSVHMHNKVRCDKKREKNSKSLET